MKTKENFEKSGLSRTEYLKPGDEIDENMFNSIMEYNVPQFHHNGIVQENECTREEGGLEYYDTIQQIGGKYYFLGCLPKFKKPKN